MLHLHYIDLTDEDDIRIRTIYFGDHEERNIARMEIEKDPNREIVPCDAAVSRFAITDEDGLVRGNRRIVAALGLFSASAIAASLVYQQDWLLVAAIAPAVFAIVLYLADLL